MLTKIPVQEARALHGLVHMPAWKAFDGLMRSELEATIERLLNTAESATQNELRGRAKMLKELLDVTTTTQSLLQKLEK